MKQVIIALTVLVAIMLTAGCGSKTNNSTQSGQGTEKLICNMSLRPAIDSGYTVTRVGVWIIKGAFEDSMNLTISGDTAYGTFNSLSVGTYSISVKAYDNQTLIAEGSGTGEVIAGQTSVARIRLYFVTGGITIIVGWGSEDVWTAKTAMPRAVWALSGIALNGKVYAISGHLEDSTVFWEFNPALNTWSSKTPMPEAHGTSPAVAAVGGKIYVIGGMNTNATHVYDPTLNSWETKTSMPTFRYYAGAAVVDGKIYVIGGLTESGSTSKVEMYDPAMDTWTTKAPMSVARHGLAVVEAGGSIFAIGGG